MAPNSQSPKMNVGSISGKVCLMVEACRTDQKFRERKTDFGSKSVHCKSLCNASGSLLQTDKITSLAGCQT